MKSAVVCRALLLALPLLLPALPAFAVVTPARLFHFGDNDPTVVPGTAATSSRDVVTANPLTLSGAPIYVADGATPYSDRSIEFDGATQSASTPNPDALTTEFGVEVWVKPASTGSGTSYIFYSGDPDVSGWGIIQDGSTGKFRAQFGSLGTFGEGNVRPGSWTHLAFVVSGGTSTFYVNGVAAGTLSTVPSAPGSTLAVAATPTSPPAGFFGGRIDKLRVFTFSSGSFAVSDLLYAPPLALAVTKSGSGAATLTWPAKYWFYRPYACDDLAVGNWTPVGGETLAGQNFVSTDASASPRRFYRLQRDVQPRLADGQFILIRTNNVTKIMADPNAANANRIVGNAGGSMDATGFVDPAAVDAGTDGSDFHWIIQYPTIDQYTDAGTTGYRKPVLSFVPRALAQEPSPPDSRAPGVRYTLEVTSKRTGLTTVVQFQSQVVQSALSLALYNDCQTQVEACPTCICTIAAALPTNELTRPAP